jgi:NAD(P)-dependent dehydrogenase (short-subunit alcohol dehydrogenase family)
MAEVSKAALITGCSSGIGKATAERLHERGWNVYATARNVDSLTDLAERGMKTLALDVTNEGSMKSAVDTVTDAEGYVGVLVNNAGYSQSGAVEEVPLEDWRRQIETNVLGLVRMCQLVLPGMREQHWGRIVNVSSMGGRMTFPGGGAYHASKYAVEALSDALRFEVDGFGVKVVLIEPGLIKTRFGETAVTSIHDSTPDSGPYAKFNAMVAQETAGAYDGPMARLGAGPEAVAKVIEKAISSNRPKPRYKVTPSARIILGIRRILPDRGWDAFMGSQFPRPGKGSSD